MRILSSLVVIFCAFFCQTSSADEAANLAFFEQHIRPALIEHCYQCHSVKAEALKGGLLLDSKAGWLAGGDSDSSAIVPGQPDASLLIRSLRYEDGLEMPPSGPLPESIIANFETWIAAGATDPRTAEHVEPRRGDKSWWSLQPLQANSDFGLSTIDDLVAAELAKKSLSINPPAEARQLIRRMTYDVIGLPPSYSEVESFSTDYARDPNTATEALVDRLLASPHYGEHWGRHWLDVVRFGESVGFERNVIIDDLWPFRDYVIRSMNDDKPFNQFIVEHLAGDVIGKNQPEVEVGAAFLVAGPYDDVANQDLAAQANIRAATLDEIITATSGAFLGLTINCARCHAHKFDPIPAEDYYRLRATFEGVQHGRRVVASREQLRRHTEAISPLNKLKRQLEKQLQSVEKQIEERSLAALEKRSFPRPAIDPQTSNEETFAPIAAQHVRLLMHASTASPQTAVNSRLVEFEIWTSELKPRNVALASQGAVASGARSAVAEDFPDAYGPQFVNDGLVGEQWFIGQPAELLISLANVETIDRCVLSNAKGANIQDKAQGATPVEYEVQVSLDGETWKTVADTFDRNPFSAAHGAQRLRHETITAEESQQLADLKQRIAANEQEIAAVGKLPQMWVGNPSQPTEATRLHLGGDPQKPGEVVAAASLGVLAEPLEAYELAADAPEADRRLALAKWIVADDNPLTARVLANRVWQYHFGTGIVDTPSDFGFLGGRPSHPELLDYLAARLISSGWRLKPLHREILLSRTYRQSAQFIESAAAIDKDSRLLWRFPPRRLSAEEIRDTMLLLSGQLQGYFSPSDPTAKQNPPDLAGGPGFRLYRFTQNNVCTYFPLEHHGPETYRRAVYHQNARASVVDLLTDFDLPDIAFAAPVRASTTTPLQSLTLLNHSFTLDMAEALAALIRQTAGPSSSIEQVDQIFQIALQRLPTDSERAAAAILFQAFGVPALCRAVFNLNEVLHVE